MKKIRLQKDTQSATQDLYIYGEIGAPDWLDGITSQDVASELKAADTATGLRVRINSLGGLAHEGIAIYNLLKEWPADVDVRVDGMAASAASVIAMAGNTISMATGSMMNIHDPWAMTIGPAADHAAAIKELDVYAQSLASIYDTFSGAGLVKIRKIMELDTTYSAETAVAVGFATQVVGDKAVAAYRDDSLLPLFATESRIAAWAPLLPEAKGTPVRDAARVKLALTRAKTTDMIWA